MNRILISQCLYGDKIVRYDAKETKLEHTLLEKLKADNRLIPICPEVMGGLQVPRPPAEIVDSQIININGEDVTCAYKIGVNAVLDLIREEPIICALLKERSPSCGCNHIYDGSFSRRLKVGKGCLAEALDNIGISLFSEEQLEAFDSYLKNVLKEV